MSEQQLGPAERIVVAELVGDRALLGRLALHEVPLCPAQLHRSSFRRGRKDDERSRAKSTLLLGDRFGGRE
jgi:hypothetical protein